MYDIVMIWVVEKRKNKINSNQHERHNEAKFCIWDFTLATLKS